MVERSDLEQIGGPFVEVLEDNLNKRLINMLRKIPIGETTNLTLDPETIEQKFTLLSKLISDVFSEPFIESFIEKTDTGKRYVVCPPESTRKYVIEINKNSLSLTPKRMRTALNSLID